MWGADAEEPAMDSEGGCGWLITQNQRRRQLGGVCSLIKKTGR